MANRTSKVTLLAQVNGYLEGMDKAARKTREFGSEAEKLAQKRAAFEQLGRASLAVGVLAAAGVAMAVKKYAEFDQAMSNVQAALQETTANQNLLREAALRAGADTVYSATEAAGAIEELGKAGLSTQQIINGGLDGALSLAAAGQLDVAQAAQVAAIAVKQFNLEGSDVPHVADLLAAGAGKAVGDVDDLSQALNQAGLVASNAGFSIEETTGVLAAFADAGLLGSDAGTSLKTAIIALQKPTEIAQKTLDKYGISVYDANGNMLGFEQLAGQLETKLGGLTAEQRNAALATIFGNDAIRSANVLYTQGSAGIAKYIKQTNDSGYAAKVAADRLDNLAGDLEKLGGSFETNLIKSGSGANDVMRGLTQSATFLVDRFGELPEPALAAGLAVGVVAAAVALTGGSALIAVPKVAEFKASLEAMGISASTTAIKVGLAGVAIGAAALIIGSLIAAQAEARAKTEAYADSLDAVTHSATNATRALTVDNLSKGRGIFGTGDSAYDLAEKLGIALDDLTDAALGDERALARVQSRLDEVGGEYDEAFKSGQKVSDELAIQATTAQLLEDALYGEAGALAESAELARQKADADDAASSATSSLASGLGDTAVAASNASDEIEGLADQIRNFYGQALSAEKAESNLQQAIDDATDSFKENGAALDLSTKAGRDNRDALRELVESAQESAAAILENGGSAEDAAAAMTRGRDALEVLRTTYGLSAEDVATYNAALNLTPEQIVTQLQLQGIETAAQKLQEYKDLLATITASGNVVGVPVQTTASTFKVPGKADGGAILGAGGPRDDNVLIRASVGEHMLDARDVQMMGGQQGVYAFRRSLYETPSYVPAQQAPVVVGGSESSQSVTVNVHGADANTVAEIVLQQVAARLRSKR